MDEICNLTFEMQAKLLCVLQEREVRAIGSNRPCKVDVRIIVSSNVALRKKVDEQRFREDLYYRLHVYPIYIPTLNERREDIPMLVNHFLKKFSSQQKKRIQTFHGSILNFMQRRNWPRNIRELENFVERPVTLAQQQVLVLNQDLLPNEFRKEFRKLEVREQPAPGFKTLPESLTNYEARIIRQVLEENT
ncbi:MAG: sigma 54-interacting transcriptional regulator [bacterium]